MKKTAILIVLVMLAALLWSGCSKGGDVQEDVLATETAPAATPTPGPVYTEEDVIGTWRVGSILDSAGVSLSESEMQSMDTGFSLELLAGGDYFVYDADGMALGQGTYSVSSDVLILSADGSETRYVIDADTLTATSDDDSVTVMVRCCTDTETDVPDTDTPEETDDIEDEAA